MVYGYIFTGIISSNINWMLSYSRTGRPNLDYGGVGKKAIENYLYYMPQAKRVFIGKSTKYELLSFS